MLKVQKYLQENGLEALKYGYSIETTNSPIGEPLIILNYSQIDSPKHSPITKECRGLVLDTNTFECVARPFSRFFNYGEWREDINKFDWNNFTTQSKEDGSLAIVYNYQDSWRMNTRASFSNGKPCDESPFTWEELFFNTINEKQLDSIDKDLTLIFELCSPWNKIVRHYPEPTSFLLTAINRKTGEEISAEKAHSIPHSLSCKSPSTFTFYKVEDILQWLENCPEPTFEGFVIKDTNNLRIKLKNKNYLRLHSMRGNGGTLFSPKNLVPFILSGETDELLAIYPEVKPYVTRYEEIIQEELLKIEKVYFQIRNRNTQKSFAIKVMELLPKWSSILFNCRKLEKDPVEIMRESGDLILKVLDKELSSVTMNAVKPSQLEGE